MDAKIQEFHELSGVTISEKNKAFRIYLRDVETKFESDQSKLDLIINSITPRTYLEALFKVEMLLHFRRFHQLIEVIKSENKILIGKVMKNAWLFNEMVKKITPEELVNDIFTHTSYSTRMKILNKLCKRTAMSNDYAEQLFEAYSEKYGIHSAKQLLPLLSSEKIKEILSSNELNISTSLLKHLINKDPNLNVILWQKYENYIVPYLANRDVIILWKCIENGACEVHLGRKATKKVIRQNKEYVIKHPEKCLKYLKLREVVKRLGNSYNEMFRNWFVQEFINSHNIYYRIHFTGLFDYLKHLDKQRQMALFTDVYTQVFKKAPWEDIDKITYPLALNYIIDTSRRDAIAEMKYSENIETIEWITYMSIEKSIPMLKEKIALSSELSARSTLLGFLVKTCKINNDLSALLEIEKYVLRRHRNDLHQVRENFMSSLCESFKIEELNFNHWKNILELLVLFELNKEKLELRRTILQKRLLHCWLNNLPIKQHLIAFLKEYGTSGINTCLSGSTEFKRTLLELIPEVLPDAFPKQKDLAQAYKILFNVTKQFNENNSKKLRISLLNLEQCLSESVQILIDNNVYLTDIFWYFIYNKESNFRARMLNIFWKQKELGYGNLQIMVWLLLNESESALQNFDRYTAPEFYKCLVNNRKFFNVIKRYNQITENLVKKVLNVFKNDTYNCDQRANAIKILSFLVDELSYCDLASEFYPKESHLDLNLDDSSTTYSIQTAICAGFKNLCIPSLAIPSILQFCTGDYLKVVLSSLYNVFYHTSEKKLYAIVEKLLDKPLSVRKHALFLNSAVLDTAFVLKTLDAFTRSKESPFMQCHLFKVSFKYFCKNPDDNFWNLIQSFIMNVDNRDEETFKMLVDAEHIPKKYLAKYIQFAWEVLEQKDPDIAKLKYNVLSDITEDTIDLLSKEFCEKVISEDLEQENGIVWSFTLKYLYCQNKLDLVVEKLEFVFNILQNIKTTYAETNKGKFLKIIHNFTEAFINFALQRDETQLPLEFKVRWEEVVEIEEDFNNYIALTILMLHLTTPPEHYIEEFSPKFADFLFELENKFGIVTFISFKQQIQQLINKAFRNALGTRFNDISTEFCENVLISRQCLSTALYVITDIISNQWTIRTAKMDVSSIIELLKDRPEAIIRMHLNHYLRMCSE